MTDRFNKTEYEAPFDVEYIKSMRAQMSPSDEVVNDLLEKIKALEAAPLRDNVVPIVSAPKPAAPKKNIMKKVYAFGTIAIAGAIMLVSTVSIFGDNGNPNEVINEVIDVGNVATEVIVPNDDPQDVTVAKPNEDENVNTVTAPPTVDKPTKPEKQDKKPGKDENKPQKDDNTQEPVTDDPTVTTPGTDIELGDTPAPKPPTEKTWTREILAESNVNSITISGTNYVVSETKATVETGAEIKKMSLDMEEGAFDASAKKLKNISTDVAVCLVVDGFKDSLIYVNKDYKPNNLGDFVKDLALSSDTSYTSWMYCQGELVGRTTMHKYTVDGLGSLVKKYLLSNSDASLASKSEYSKGTTKATFRSTANPIGSTIDFGVSDNGYLYVKLSNGSTYTFNIGAENAVSFITEACK